ncbi:uncharacterized protein LOC105440857 [Strongylocentrotus purpuratus]|uniref:Uncharacterized protein n=1 Tax=Strongylocentrotus purpuratus TaxID=7668 RepID=A0A7M7NJ71_STRPU|nr:uncharacterized protein LOC105440857 [Strongylocentrotus purpuratus]
MADKKARAPRGGSKAPSKPRPDEKPDGVSSWGTLKLAEVPVLGTEVRRAPGAPVPLNSLGLPDPSGVENTSFIEEELGGITDRLNRALGDIATLYNENGDEQLEPEVSDKWAFCCPF